MKLKYYMLYPNFFDKCQRLDDAEIIALLKALVKYIEDGTIPEFDRTLGGYFDVFKGDIDQAQIKYKEVCEKRSVAGRKGADRRWNSGKGEGDDICMF